MCPTQHQHIWESCITGAQDPEQLVRQIDAHKRDRQARVAEARAAHEYSELLDCTFTPAITRMRAPPSTAPVVVRGLERYMELQVCPGTVLCCAMLCCAVLNCSVPCRAMLSVTHWRCTLFCGLYHNALYWIVLLCAIPYHTIPYHTVPYHTIPYHTIPYHTVPDLTLPYLTYLYLTCHRLLATGLTSHSAESAVNSISLSNGINSSLAIHLL